MDAPRPQLAFKFLPSLTDMAFLMPIIFIFGRMDGLKTLLGDCDTGWHIRTGEWILAHHRVPLHDIFSFTKPDGVWYAWEWLSDVLFAWLHGLGGLRTLCLFAMMLISFIFVMLFRLTRKNSNAIVAIVVTMTAAASTSIHWLTRPHLFTVFFALVFYGALESVRAGKTRLGRIPYLVILPVLTILWTNLHGGFFVGAILIGAYAVGDLLKAALTPDPSERRPALLRARGYLLSVAGCLAASLVNPYTWRLHQHVFAYLTDPYQSQHIVEFFSISFHHPMAIFFEAMLLTGAIAAAWHASKGRYVESVLIVLWGHGALLAARNIPLFAITAAPVIASAVEEWIAAIPSWNLAAWVGNAVRKFSEVAGETDQTDRIPRWHIASALGMIVFVALMYAPNPPKSFQAEFDPKSFPAGAIATLRQQPDARIFAQDQWGDYLIYRLYPRTKVFTDGRSDFYGSDFGKKYLDVMGAGYSWEKTLGGYGVDTILLSPSTPLAGALKESPRWRVVYDDGVSLVFRSAQKTWGQPLSATGDGDGDSRDREVTKTHTGDQAITKHKV